MESLAIIKSYNRRHNTPDLHSFVVRIKNGVAFVDCQGSGIFISATTSRENAEQEHNQWWCTVEEAASKLEELGVDWNTLED